MKYTEQEKQACQMIHLATSGIDLSRVRTRPHLIFKTRTKLEKKQRHNFDKIATSMLLFSYKNHNLSIKISLRGLKLETFLKNMAVRRPLKAAKLHGTHTHIYSPPHQAHRLIHKHAHTILNQKRTRCSISLFRHTFLYTK